jgi:hypothetical protein
MAKALTAEENTNPDKEYGLRPVPRARLEPKNPNI